MDAVEFIKQYQRMCKFYDSCESCELSSDYLSSCYLDSDPKKSVRVVEQWAQTHPQKTMMNDFFKKHPNAPRTEDGAPRNICPSDCGYTNELESHSTCDRFNDDCAACWSRPLEE